MHVTVTAAPWATQVHGGPSFRQSQVGFAAHIAGMGWQWLALGSGGQSGSGGGPGGGAGGGPTEPSRQ